MNLVKNKLGKEIDIKSNFYNELFSKHKEYIIEQAFLVSSAINDTITKKGKVIVCGNGGSQSQSSHLCAELIVRFKSNSKRPSLAALSLGSDASITTACSNDFGYENIFSRQLEALLHNNDCFISFSTSGNSENIKNALSYTSNFLAKEKIFLITGNNHIKNKGVSTICCPEIGETDTYQEFHLLLIHMICYSLECIYK